MKPSMYTYSTSEFKLVTFQVVNSYMWQVATRSGSIVKISQTEKNAQKNNLVLNYYLMFSCESNLKPLMRVGYLFFVLMNTGKTQKAIPLKIGIES